MSDFDHQKAACGEVIRRGRNDPTHEVETVASAGERELRLVTVLGRQLAHRSGRDVRRVRENQVVLCASEVSQEIRLDEPHPTLQPIIRDVTLCNLEGRPRNIGGIAGQSRWVSGSIGS